MAVTFPKDINCKQGAGHHIASGNDFNIPSRQQESLEIASQTAPQEGTVMHLSIDTYKEESFLDFDSNTGVIFGRGSNISVYNYGVNLGIKESIKFRFSSNSFVYFPSSLSGEVVSYVPK